MPELPEVETVVRQIRPELCGRTITAVTVAWKRCVARPSAAAFARELVGRRFTGATRRAKYFLLALDDGRVLVGHLRMTGRLFVQDSPADRFARASFALDDGRHLVFSDVRKFGRLALVSDVAAALPVLGPEPLSAEFTGEWLHAALRARDRRLKPLLLDQAFVAGLGNIYVDESLHRARLHPLRSSAGVSRRQATALAAAVREVLTEAIAAEGSSFDTFYRTPEGRPGAFQDDFRVYARDGLPCRACGATIAKTLVGQRGTHWCPRCQRVPRGLARGAGARDASRSGGAIFTQP